MWWLSLLSLIKKKEKLLLPLSSLSVSSWEHKTFWFYNTRSWAFWILKCKCKPLSPNVYLGGPHKKSYHKVYFFVSTKWGKLFSLLLFCINCMKCCLDTVIFLVLLYIQIIYKESENVGRKLNIRKTKIMASGPITSWQIDEETVESVRLYFLGLQNHCRLWLQPWN